MWRIDRWHVLEEAVIASEEKNVGNQNTQNASKTISYRFDDQQDEADKKMEKYKKKEGTNV